VATEHPKPCWSLSTRVKLVVAYDGTDFRGWAAHAGHRTVQGTLTEAVRQATGEDWEITGASRTDSGAHALGQVCHFDAPVAIPPTKWTEILNRWLPDDVRVRSSVRVGSDFHSRFCAEDRHYEYRLLLVDGDPFRGRTAHRALWRLELDAMRHAAAMLVGEHDFRAFTEELDPSVLNTTRRLLQVRIEEDETGDLISVHVVGTAFLRGMMRRIAGALLEIGRGRRPVEDVARLLSEPRGETHRPEVLPAKGLTLRKVRYANPPRDHRKDE
jgi:tRNA pseudouridine38-40 synthase